MSFSDYGGVAVRNDGTERRTPERCDAFLRRGEAGLEVVSTPGTWPGFAHSDADACQHVIIGEGKRFVGLYKQSTAKLWGFPRDVIESVGVAAEVALNLIGAARGKLVIERRSLRIVWWYDDALYVGARLRVKGASWFGWSGYLIGAGHEQFEWRSARVERSARKHLSMREST